MAEDNKVNQRVACKLLERLGVTVVTADNGFKALEAVGRESFDAILMDCQMPVMDGIEATKEIRRLEGPPAETPIIALTANAMKGDRERCLDAGMTDYMSKPLSSDKLLETLLRNLATAVRVMAEAEESTGLQGQGTGKDTGSSPPGA